MERVEFQIKVFDNFIEITPVGGVKDNSVYEIKIKNLKQLGGRAVLDSASVKLVTELTPAYASLQAVESLVESCGIEKQTILFHIREASKYVDFVKGVPQQGQAAFEVEQFVKYKAAHECVLRYYIDRTSESGNKGTLGDVQFDNSVKLADISELLKALRAQADEWKDALRGYKNEGRAKPVSAVKSSYIPSPRQFNDDPPHRSGF